MRFYLAFTLCCLVAISVAKTTQDQFLRQNFETYKQKYGKAYTSLEENNMRFSIYHENLKMIEKHNAEYQMGLHTHYLGVNQFVDWTQEELKAYANVKYEPMPEAPEFYETFNSTSAAPPNLDWRQYNYVSPVQNQGQCGSCYTFSSCGAIEGAQAKKHLQMVNLSEQEMLDCDNRSFGCSGGFVNYNFEVSKSLGSVWDSEYRYTGVKGQCTAGGKKIAARVSEYFYVANNEQALVEAVWNNGPVSVLVNVQPIMFYAGGIFNSYCPPNLDHAVLAVGYGVEGGNAYWLIKNSYGLDWGENGYIRLGRNRGQLCGISTWAAYPKVV